MLYLIISYENLCIYTVVDSASVANALVASSIDTFVRAISPANCPNYDICAEEHFYNNVCKIATGKGMIMESSENDVSKEV